MARANCGKPVRRRFPKNQSQKIKPPQELDAANQCVVDSPQSFLALLFGDDFNFDFASSSAYDQDASEEVAVDAEITGNAEEDEVEVEVRTTFL